MPIYEYRCHACGAETDALQKVSDPPLEQCSECGEKALKRLISAPSFRLKGAGWYETDFKGDSDKKRNLAEPDSKAPAKEEKKTDKAEGGKSKAKGESKDSPKKEVAKPAAKKDTG